VSSASPSSAAEEKMEEGIRLYRSSFGRVSVLNVGTSLVTHAHDTAHIVVWLNGTPGEMTVGGTTEGLGPATAATINPFEPHSHAFPMHSGGVFLAFYLDMQWVQEQSGMDAGAPLFNTPFLELNPTQHSAAAGILRDLQEGGAEDRLVTYEIEGFLDSVIRSSRSSRTGKSRMRAANDYRVRKAVNIMKGKVAERICFDELARSVGLSRPHFFALFKEQMNLTPNIYWNSLRAEEATRQLEHTDDSLISVACSLGFSTQGNFSRFFREHVGVPPRTYRIAARSLS
jgi:AraC-like DNA-binding protein